MLRYLDGHHPVPEPQRYRIRSSRAPALAQILRLAEVRLQAAPFRDLPHRGVAVEAAGTQLPRTERLDITATASAQVQDGVGPA